jgi:hypothetical protein
MSAFYTLTAADNATGKPGSPWAIQTAGSPEERWPLDSGKRVANWDPELRLVIVVQGKPQDLSMASASWHVMSGRMRDVIDSVAPKAIQFLPAKVRTIIGKVEKDPYCVANYLHLVDVLHRKASKVDESRWKKDETGQFEGLIEPVLDLKLLKDHSIFRVQGASELVVFREDTVAAIRKRKLTGCVFTKIKCAK